MVNDRGEVEPFVVRVADTGKPMAEMRRGDETQLREIDEEWTDVYTTAVEAREAAKRERAAEGTESTEVKSKEFDRTVPSTPEAKRAAIKRIVSFAKSVKNRVERAVIGGITARQKKDFAANGIDVDETWVHSIENSAVSHNQKHHGNDRESYATANVYAGTPQGGEHRRGGASGKGSVGEL